MKIKVLGMDPSLRNWGLAQAELDLSSGELTTPVCTLVHPKDFAGKQVRKNSEDLHRAVQLADVVLPAAQQAQCVFVEIPVGSQSARAMASYGICIGILGTITSLGIPLIEVTPTENKKVFTGKPTATKQQMIAQALEFYPDVVFPMYKGEVQDKAEHLADAIASIHAGVHTPTFQNLMRLFQKAQTQ